MPTQSLSSCPSCIKRPKIKIFACDVRIGEGRHMVTLGKNQCPVGVYAPERN